MAFEISKRSSSACFMNQVKSIQMREWKQHHSITTDMAILLRIDFTSRVQSVNRVKKILTWSRYLCLHLVLVSDNANVPGPG